MNISVKKLESKFSHLTGGECTAVDMEIEVDTTLPFKEQQGLIIHTIVENYCRSWTHDKVEELTDLIQDALDKLEEVQDE